MPGFFSPQLNSIAIVTLKNSVMAEMCSSAVNSPALHAIV